MLKRVLHTANQVVTHEETHTGTRELTIENTVNDNVDMLTVTGDSWQLVQEAIKDEEGNVTQPAMPSTEYPSEIISVNGEMASCGWNLLDCNPNSWLIGCATSWGAVPGTKYDLVTKNHESHAVVEIPVLKNTKYGMFNFDTEHYRIYRIIESDDDGLGWRNHAYYAYSINIEAGFFVTTEHTTKLIFEISTIPDSDGNTPPITEELIKAAPIIVQEGATTISDFKPYDHYRGNSITLPTLRSLPDGTKDVLYVDRKNQRAWVERKIGETVLDGSERTWKIYYENENKHVYEVNINNALRNWSSLNVYCSHFKSETGRNMYIGDYTGSACSILQNTRCLFGSTDRTGIFESIDTFKAFLNENPVTVQYGLIDPIIEELPYSDYLLETEQYQTNIRMTGLNENLKPEITAQCKILGR